MLRLFLRQPPISHSRVLARYHSLNLSTCPSCSKKLPTPLPACPNCAFISSIPSHLSYHDLFGLPYRPNPFTVDLSHLKQGFRKAQAVCHPDAWSSKGPEKLQLAQALSSQLNRGYQALLSPYLRVEYILERNDVTVSETDTLEDAAFLSDIMDTREALEEADVDGISGIEKVNQKAIHHIQEEIQDLVEQEDWDNVKKAAIRLKCLKGIEEAIKDKINA